MKFQTDVFKNQLLLYNNILLEILMTLVDHSYICIHSGWTITTGISLIRFSEEYSTSESKNFLLGCKKHFSVN